MLIPSSNITAATSAVETASSALSALKSESRYEITRELVGVQSRLSLSTDQVEKFIHTHRKGRITWSALQTRSRKERKFHGSLEKVVQHLELLANAVETTHQLSAKYSKDALELQNTHLKPARNAVQSLRSDVELDKRCVETDLYQNQTKLQQAEDRKRTIEAHIKQKQIQITQSEWELRNKGYEMDRIRNEQVDANRQRDAKLREAARLREEARHRRKKGKVVGLITFGMGLGYTAYQYDMASDCKVDAGNAERQCSELSSRLSSLNSSYNGSERTSRALKSDMASLESSKNRLDQDFKSQINNISGLQTRLTALQSQARDAEQLLQKASGLNTTTDGLFEAVTQLRTQLMEIKQGLSQMQTCVDEHSARTIHVRNKTRRVGYTEEGRQLVISVLAATVPELEGWTAEVRSAHLQLLPPPPPVYAEYN